MKHGGLDECMGKIVVRMGKLDGNCATGGAFLAFLHMAFSPYPRTL